MGSTGAIRSTATGISLSSMSLSDTVTQSIRSRLDEIAMGDEPIGKFWDRSSELTNLYNQLADAADNEEFKFTQATLNTMHQYYRYYNDGDVPGWATYNNGFRTSQYDRAWGGSRSRLTGAGEMELERRAAKSVVKEYDRYRKARR